jgi:hypothetical protein
MARKQFTAMLVLGSLAVLSVTYAAVRAEEGWGSGAYLSSPPGPPGGSGNTAGPGGPGGPGAVREGPEGPRVRVAGPGMRPGMPMPVSPEMAERMGGVVGLVSRMSEVCGNPQLAAMVAIAGLKEDVKRKPEEVIKELEDQLGKLKTLGLRNAVRLLLRDLYKAQGEDAKVLEQLRAMIAENEAAIQAHEKPAK